MKLKRLALLLLLAGCFGGGSKPVAILRADPTRSYPVTWDGKGTAEPAPAARPKGPRIGPKQLVAVLELHSKLRGKDADEVDAGYFANQVRADIKSDAPAAQVMTRENVLVMLQSAGKTLEDCEGECEVDTGRRLGADLVVSGELVRVGTKLKVDLRMHDTHSGQLIAGVTAQGKSVDELDADLARAVKSLLGE